jgi:hydrogenase 3 maturation protease
MGADKRVLVLGIGNRLKGDDGFGSILADRLKALEGEGLKVIDAGEVPENYIHQILDFAPQYLIILDTICLKDKKPGEIVILKEKDVGNLSISTHAPSLSLFLKVLRLSGLNFKAHFLGVVPKNVNMGEGFSEEVKEAIKLLEENIFTYIRDLRDDQDKI